MRNLEPAVAAGLASAGLSPDRYRYSADNSLRGPCVRCGGSRRMVVYLNEDFPGWFLACDLCSVSGWLPNIIATVKWGEGRSGPRNRDAAPRDYSAVLGRLRDERPDLLFHNNLTDEHRAQWRAAGIPDDMQDFWWLGFAPGHPFRAYSSDDDDASSGSIMVLDALTIPKYSLGWELHNIDFRMLGAPKQEGKYRPIGGAPSSPFIARPDRDSLLVSSGEYAIVVEGSKKAMVLSIFLGNEQVVGIPSNNSWAGIVNPLQSAPRVYVLLDPDSWNWADKMTREIGPAARHVTLPDKVDDLIMRGQLTPETLHRFFGLSRGAMPAKTKPPRPPATAREKAPAGPEMDPTG